MAINIYDTATVARLSAAQSETSIIDRFRNYVARRREEARIRSELNAMSHRDLADLGLAESDINDVARGTYRRA